MSTGHGDGNNRKKKHCGWWCGGKYGWRAPNRILVVQLGTNANEAKVFKAHVAPQGLCENLVNALELLAKQQTDADNARCRALSQAFMKEGEKDSWMG